MMPRKTVPGIHALARLALLAGTIGLAACASVGAPERSESPDERDGLIEGPDGVRSWRSTSDLRRARVCVAGSDVGFGARVGLDAAERLELQAAMDIALQESLAAAGLQLGDPPCGPGDLRVRSTIVSAERASPAANAVTALVLLAPLSRGGLTVEFEAEDAATGRRVAALAIRARAGVADIAGAFSELGHARRQAHVASERFARLLAGG
ncbi:MAG: DUF3313 family protein [Piscinibacter sp.]|uniref:DUF3313 family protein n=1 Tax=Piscinibacter sp. TaxID=1903157 RepID=UPI002584283C|nr:DUF3313 family protein [Piscinibacter sp.]MCW5662406.1 DUF3313 family protein [Piscinibacter sp.]